MTLGESSFFCSDPNIGRRENADLDGKVGII